MKGLGRQLTALALAMVIATALVGAAQTLWFEELRMEASVSTGTLDAKIVCGSVLDNDNQDAQVSTVPGFPMPPANVGDINVGATGSQGDHQFTIAATNAYPGYALDCKVELTNNATVAWHLEAQEVSATVDGQAIAWQAPPACDGTNCKAGSIAPTDATKDPLWITVGDLRGCQLHAGESKNSRINIGFNKSAEELKTYNIRITFEVNQWNVSDWAACGISN